LGNPDEAGCDGGKAVTGGEVWAWGEELAHPARSRRVKPKAWRVLLVINGWGQTNSWPAEKWKGKAQFSEGEGCGTDFFKRRCPTPWTTEGRNPSS